MSSVTEEEVLALLRCKCREAGSQRAWARANGMTAAYVSAVLTGHMKPGKRILQALGVERVSHYRKLEKQP